MRKFIILTLLVLSITLLAGQDITKTGTSSAQFLKIGMSARGTGMGEAMTAIVSDGSSMFWNPAGMSKLSSGEISIGYTNWLAGITISNLTVAYPVPGLGTIGVYTLSLNVPRDEVTTVSQPEGTGEFFDGSDFSVGVSYAKNVTDRFAFGVVAKYIQERIWTMSAASMAVDVGSIYRSEWRNFRIGFVLRNFGTAMRFSGRANLVTTDPDPSVDGNNEHIRAELELEDWDIPMHLTTSFALDIISTPVFDALLAVDMVHPNDNVEYFNAGIELGIMDMLYLRAGQRNLGQTEALGTTAFGAGLHVPYSGKSFSLDYSIADFGPFKNVNQVTILYNF